MKAITLKFAIKFGAAAFLVCGGFSAQGEDRTVTNAQGLVEALEALNSGSASGNTIYLEPGNYDVSPYAMIQWGRTAQGSSSISHIALGHVKLVGKSDNPRDVVIYGNGTERILHAQCSTVECLTISNGYRTASSASAGAGVLCANSDADVYRSHFSNVVVTCCSTVSSGGGVAYGVWRDCELSYNNAGEDGGGAGYAAELVDCRVFGNSAKNGGGCADCGYRLYVSGGVISNNTATATGGGAYSCVFLGGTDVCFNMASGDGGGLYSGESRPVTNCVVRGNIAHGTKGGGISMYRTEIVGCVVSNNFLDANSNSGATGGGIYANGGFVCDSRIVFNKVVNANDGGSSGATGGGVSGGTVSNCTVSGNAVLEGACTAGNRMGGGCQGSALVNCLVTDNFVYQSERGSGINQGSAYGCVISNNASTKLSASVRLTTFLEDCEICGALANPKRMLNCRVVGFTNGVVIAEGANVYTNGLFSGSSYLCEGDTFATNCLFAGNRVESRLFRPGSASGVSLVNCTVVDNSAQRTFYDTKSSTLSAEAVNCIFTGNTYNGNARNMWYETTQNYITLRNCMIGSGRQSVPVQSETDTVTGDDPKFIADGSRDSYALRLRSPARGKGLVQSWMSGAYDIRGSADGGKYLRLRDTKVDIGCYQCWLELHGFFLYFH